MCVVTRTELEAFNWGLTSRASFGLTICPQMSLVPTTGTTRTRIILLFHLFANWVPGYRHGSCLVRHKCGPSLGFHELVGAPIFGQPANIMACSTTVQLYIENDKMQISVPMPVLISKNCQTKGFLWHTSNRHPLFELNQYRRALITTPIILPRHSSQVIDAFSCLHKGSLLFSS